MRGLLVVLTLVAGMLPAQSQSAKDRPSAKATLTGCVDERAGEYVLTNDTNLQPTARLKPAAGSPEDNFARHVGHKVKLQGILSKEEPLPVMTVQSVALVAETCTPSAETDKP